VADYEGENIRRKVIPGALVSTGIPKIMGIVNVTPDSFHAESRFGDVERGIAMWESGATWIDVGGESTRPNAEQVGIEEERSRVIPVIKGLRGSNPDGFISVDTRHVEVAKAALDAGADMINDVSGLRDPEMFELVVNSGCAVCVMHMQGNPENMQVNPSYVDAFSEVSEHLENVANKLVARGHPANMICLDPGIGFGKNLQHNLDLLKAPISENYPTLWGVSRKSIIGMLTETPNPADRLPGTIASSIHAMRLGIDILRVHDVSENIEALKMYSELR